MRQYGVQMAIFLEPNEWSQAAIFGSLATATTLGSDSC
jgi:hypothetical protein